MLVAKSVARRSWGPSWRSNVAEEARTRGFASLTFVRFAFVGYSFALSRLSVGLSIRGCTYSRQSLKLLTKRQLWVSSSQSRTANSGRSSVRFPLYSGHWPLDIFLFFSDCQRSSIIFIPPKSAYRGLAEEVGAARRRCDQSWLSIRPATSRPWGVRRMIEAEPFSSPR